MRAVRWHTDNPWVLLYLQRWRTAPFQRAAGTREARQKGPPQGGVGRPLRAHLFLHYAVDRWMVRHHPDKPFERYADEAVVHCRTEADAERLKAGLGERVTEVGLERHPTKTRIVYCKDDDRRGQYPPTSYDFLGSTCRPRRSKSRFGHDVVNLTPAVSRNAQPAMQQNVHGWRMHLKVDKALEDLSRMFNPIIRGWIQYYGHFYKSELYGVLRHINRALVRWAQRKYKKLARHRRRAEHWLGRIA